MVMMKNKIIEDNISAGYGLEKSTMLRQKRALLQVLNYIESAKTAWMDNFAVQKNFSEHIASEALRSGEVRSRAERDVNDLRRLQKDLMAEKTSAKPHSRIQGHIRTYVNEIESIEKELKSIENRFAEVQRYEKKVARLTGKGLDDEKTRRNVTKLENMRADFQSGVDGMVQRMKITNDKYDAVLQCGQHAFWLVQQRYESMIAARTRSMRHMSKRLEEDLVRVDVSNDELQPLRVTRQ